MKQSGKRLTREIKHNCRVMFRFVAQGIIFTILLGLIGCAQSFPKKNFTKEDTSYLEELKNEVKKNNPMSKVELGRLYFMHNFIDEADQVLVEAVDENPNDMEALAWLGANNCKKIGASMPWFLGVRKLYLVNKCLNQVDEALSKEPDNFTITLISINTGAAVNAFGSLEKANARLKHLKSKIEKQKNNYADDALSHFHLAASKVEIMNKNIAKAKDHLQIIVNLDANSELVNEANELLKMI